MTQVLPSERSVNTPVIKEAMEIAKARGTGNLTPAMVEGFVSAKVLVEAPRRAQARPRAPAHGAGKPEEARPGRAGAELQRQRPHRAGFLADLSIMGNDGRFKR
ncbi:MAG: hypothetical protein RBS27_08715 [Giesbergeria sp.]|nr:hypothetical protein [Giesbergeria sp.]